MRRIAIALVGLLILRGGMAKRPAAPEAVAPEKPVAAVRPFDTSLYRIDTRPKVREVKEPALFVEGLAPVVRAAPPNYIPILRDAFSRLPDAERFRCPIEPGDFITWAHEAHHGVTAKVCPPGGYGIYCGDGRSVIFRSHPKVTIGEVAASIPKADRGAIFQLYLVEQRRYWDRQPLYIVDEFNSYRVGAIARQQLGWTRRQETERHAMEMSRYCRAMLALAKKEDPSWPELRKLERLLDWQDARLAEVMGDGRTLAAE
jgi:hypothetical protein